MKLFGRSARRTARQKGAPVYFAGRFWDWATLCKHVLFLGGVGMGKTFASNLLIRELMRAGCPMICTCVKPDDFERLYNLAKEVGQASRVAEITPHKTGMNLLGALLTPDRDASVAAELLTRIGQVGERKGHAEEFWVAKGKQANISAIDLSMEVEGGVDIPRLYETLVSTPESLAEVEKSPEWQYAADFVKDEDGRVKIERRRCAALIARGVRAGLRETSPRFRNAEAFLTKEMPSGGEKMRGGIIAQANTVLAPFLNPPWVGALSGETTLNPRRIDEEGLIGILNYDMMTHFTPARMWQFAWTMEAQRHCMRRPYAQGTPPFVIVRDEVGWVLNSGWDLSVCLVSRSQGLAHLDLVQDVSTLLHAVDDKKSEAHAFLSNHMAMKVLFGTDDAETAKWMSELAGQRKTCMLSGGGGGKTGDWYADALGVTVPGWSQQFQPAVRIEEFSRLPVGVAYVHAGGSGEFVDFREKG